MFTKFELGEREKRLVVDLVNDGGFKKEEDFAGTCGSSDIVLVELALAGRVNTKAFAAVYGHCAQWVLRVRESDLRVDGDQAGADAINDYCAVLAASIRDVLPE